MHGGRAQVKQETIRSKDASRFVKGMDHALMRDSSQHPGEHHYIERLARVFDLLGCTYLIVDSLREPVEKLSAGFANKLGIGSVADTRAPSCARRRVSRPSPQPISRTRLRRQSVTPFSAQISFSSGSTRSEIG